MKGEERFGLIRKRGEGDLKTKTGMEKISRDRWVEVAHNDFI